MAANKILIYGYGNPGRQDDGLGKAFVDLMENWALHEGREEFCFDCNYQLNIEDAAAMDANDLVFFVDASMEPIQDFLLTPVFVEKQVAFTTHAASPGYVYDLCRQIYGHAPATYLLHIKGYEWDFKAGLTHEANDNLYQARDYLVHQLQDPARLIREFRQYEPV